MDQRDPAFHLVLAAGIAVATLAGAVLIVANLARLAGDWRAARRAHRNVAPVGQEHRDLARSAVATVAGLAGVPAPVSTVVPILGAPLAGRDTDVGSGGLALTRARPGQPITVVLTRAAVTELSSNGLVCLAAHELAHVLDQRSPRARAAQYGWLAGYTVLSTVGVVLTVIAGLTAPRLSGPALLATTAAALAFLALRAAFQRRDELAADRFAVGLTDNLAGCIEAIDLYETLVHGSRRAGRRGRLVASIESWFATHPSPAERRDAMRAHHRRG